MDFFNASSVDIADGPSNVTTGRLPTDGDQQSLFIFSIHSDHLTSPQPVYFKNKIPNIE